MLHSYIRFVGFRCWEIFARIDQVVLPLLKMNFPNSLDSLNPQEDGVEVSPASPISSCTVCDACPRCPLDRCELRECSMCADKPHIDVSTCRYFSLCEVRRHRSRSDCWLVAHGRIYDVTLFMDSHPGGIASIMKHAGSDSTVDYEFHSSKARKLWAKYYIGRIRPCHRKVSNSVKCGVM